MKRAALTMSLEVDALSPPLAMSHGGMNASVELFGAMLPPATLRSTMKRRRAYWAQPEPPRDAAGLKIGEDDLAAIEETANRIFGEDAFKDF